MGWIDDLFSLVAGTKETREKVKELRGEVGLVARKLENHSERIVRLETIVEERGRKVIDERLGQLVEERLRQALASDPPR